MSTRLKHSQPINIENKVILVTGALGLIGSSICKVFLESGAKVVFADINSSGLEKTKADVEIDFPANNYLFLNLDITDEQSCTNSVHSVIDKFGRIDVLINNAAIDSKFDKDASSIVNNSRFEYYPLDLLKKSVEVNLIGTVIITQIACKQMLKQGFGNIINVASTYSLVAPNQNLYDFGTGVQQYKPVDYIVSKSFIPNFTRYIATFYARDNIRCNTIVPHGIANNHSKEFLKNWEKLSPIGRMCNVEELSGPFMFLCSDASSYMTGSTLTIDGGWTAW